MSEYISVNELPGRAGRFPKYPYEQWARDIPIGKALAIELNGQQVHQLRQTLTNHFMRHPELGLRATAREGQLYVIREATT